MKNATEAMKKSNKIMEQSLKNQEIMVIYIFNALKKEEEEKKKEEEPKKNKIIN